MDISCSMTFQREMYNLLISNTVEPKDSFGPCGPWIVTRDDIPDPNDLQ